MPDKQNEDSIKVHYSWKKLATSGQKLFHPLPNQLREFCYSAWKFQYSIGFDEELEGKLEIINQNQKRIPVENTDDLNKHDEFWITDRSLITDCVTLSYTFDKEGYHICSFDIHCRPTRFGVPKPLRNDLFAFYFPKDIRIEYRRKGSQTWNEADDNIVVFDAETEDALFEARCNQYGAVSNTVELGAPWKLYKDFRIDEDDLYLCDQIAVKDNAHYVTKLSVKQEDQLFEVDEDGNVPKELTRCIPFEITALHQHKTWTFTHSYGPHILASGNQVNEWVKLFGECDTISEKRAYGKLVLASSGRFVFKQGAKEEKKRIQGTFTITEIFPDEEESYAIQMQYIQNGQPCHLECRTPFVLLKLARAVFQDQPAFGVEVEKKAFPYGQNNIRSGDTICFNMQEQLQPQYCLWYFTYSLGPRGDEEGSAVLRNSRGEEVVMHNDLQEIKNPWTSIERHQLTKEMFCTFFSPKFELGSPCLWVFSAPLIMETPIEYVPKWNGYAFYGVQNGKIAYRWKGHTTSSALTQNRRKRLEDIRKL